MEHTKSAEVLDHLNAMINNINRDIARLMSERAQIESQINELRASEGKGR